MTFLELTHPTWVQDWTNSDFTLRAKNGSIVYFIGADHPDRLGSIELTMALVDEAAELSKESLGMIQGRLSGEVLLPPNLEDLPDNIQQYLLGTQDLRQTFLACNPKSDSHNLYVDFINPKTKRAGHVSYISNSISNPNLPKNYLKNNLSAYLRPGYTEDWIDNQIDLIRSGQENPDGLHLRNALTPFGQRNLLALWVAMEGAVYQLDEDLVVVEQPPNDWSATGDYFGCVDFGYHNPRILICKEFTRNSRGNIEVCYASIAYWHKKEQTPDQLIEQLLTYHNRWGLKEIYMPPDQPGIIKTSQKTIGYQIIKRAKNDVQAGINICARFFARQRFVIQKVPNEGHALCWSELSGYARQTNRQGQHTEEVLKERDHYPDALRYLLYSRHHREEAIIAQTDNLDPAPTIFSIGAS